MQSTEHLSLASCDSWSKLFDLPGSQFPQQLRIKKNAVYYQLAKRIKWVSVSKVEQRLAQIRATLGLSNSIMIIYFIEYLCNFTWNVLLINQDIKM